MTLKSSEVKNFLSWRTMYLFLLPPPPAILLFHTSSDQCWEYSNLFRRSSFSLQNSIAPSSSRSNSPCRRRAFSLFATGCGFKNMYSPWRWASSWRFSVCFSLWSACKRKHFRLRRKYFRLSCGGLLLVIVVLLVDQVCDQFVQAMRNSDPRVRIVFDQRFNSEFHSVFTLQVAGCDF